jgi:hypothetical protein
MLLNSMLEEWGFLSKASRISLCTSESENMSFEQNSWLGHAVGSQIFLVYLSPP